jgi:Peptidase family S41
MRIVRTMLLVMALALTAVSAVSASRQDKADADNLTTAILAHIRLSLPPSASRYVEAERARLYSFAIAVIAESVYPTDPAKLQAAAIDSIDKSNNPSATAGTLAGAALVGMSASIEGYDSWCQKCGAAHIAAVPPTNVQIGTMRVIALRDLSLEGMFLWGRKRCSLLDHYFDFPPEGVTGLILDLRGNQGGYLPAMICITGEFLKPKTPLFRIASRMGDEIVPSPTDGRRTPITVPMVVFMDRDTESGALALAASLRDAGRADLIGESKERANGTLLTQVPTWGGRDQFLLPVGYMKRLGGAALADGVQVDVVVAPGDDDAMLEAARARFSRGAQ